MKILALLPQDSPEFAIVDKLARENGHTSIHCSDAATLRNLVGNHAGEKQAVFCSFKDRALIRDLGTINPNLSMLLFIENSLKKMAREITECLSTQTFVAQQSENLQEREILAILNHFDGGAGPGLAPYLANGTQTKKTTITNATNKLEALHAVERFVVEIGGTAQTVRFKEYSRRITELFDELVLNGIFDANPRLRNEKRSVDFVLQSEEQVKAEWAFDREIFGISVQDPFGLLNKGTILHYIDEQMVDARPILERKSAGLGFKMVLERLHQLVVNVKPNKLTEVICLMRFEKRFRDFETRLKSFHYYTL